ncbi:MAG: hypothetical protein QMD95_04375 [Candidatus Hodarchaeaceae archaeon]|nr:hypothetical protein [Candidatus Hodarchaeaceae archaeon]
MKVVEKLQLGRLVTPIPDRRRPIYNWFPLKEAFSRDLVHLLAKTWGLGEGDLVLDTFCGVATAPLACKELGLDCVGFDVHPVLLFASQVKLRDYNVEELRVVARELVKSRYERQEIEAPSFVTRVFSKPALEDMTSFKRKILEVEDEGVRDFLLLGLVNAAMDCSWAYKDGAAIKVVKRPTPPLRKALERWLYGMCSDVEKFKAGAGKCRVERCDARKLKLEDESVDAVITSPPYLGKQEYIHAYRIEQWILGLEGPFADEFIGVRARDIGEEDFSEVAGFVEDKPLEARPYFKDMLLVLRELHRVCKRGARICFVTSDGCYPTGVVEVCETLSKLAERAGFRAKRVIIVNRRYCTTPRRKKLGVAREGLLLWEK